MKYIFKVMLLLLFLVAATVIPSSSQDQATNLQKYRHYRNRLRNEFVVVSQNVEFPGVNIPASRMTLQDQVVKMDWSDGNAIMSHYLSVLSTELCLLKKNNQDYKQTLTELYYAMLAMERLDLWSESHLRDKKNIVVSGNGGTLGSDINGFHLRDDVSSEFWNQYSGHFPTGGRARDGSLRLTLFGSVYSPDGLDGDYHENSMEEMSQDNTFHNMEGLALVASLVGTESVADIPVTFSPISNRLPNYLATNGIKTGNNVNFSLWAKDFIKRYVIFFQTSGSVVHKYYAGPFHNILLDTSTNFWVLINPITGEFVKEGSGKDNDTGTFYNSGIISTGLKVVGEDLRKHDAFIVSNSKSSEMFRSLFSTGSQNVDIALPPNPFVSSIHIYDYDDYKVRSLGMNGNILGDDATFPTLRAHRIEAVNGHSYEHLPMMYSIMSDHTRHLILPGNTAYNEDKAFIENLLNTAPACGPDSYTNVNWSCDSRCVWPEKLGFTPDRGPRTPTHQYNGLDYMMLHNLYYLAFNYSTLEVNDVIFNNGVFNFDVLEAANQISAGKSASYIGKESIRFKPGFKAASGCNFNAKIVQDPGSYVSTQYSVNGIESCPTSSARASENTPIDDRHAYETLKIRTEGSILTKQPNTEKVIIVYRDDENETGRAAIVYPNPTNGVLRIISREELSAKLTVKLYSENGNLMMTTTTSDSETVLDISQYPEGLYVIKIQGNKINMTDKIMLKHP